jgi:hypothetical protein
MADISMVSVTESGTRIEQLKQLALNLAYEIDNAGEKTNVAQLARQYRETLREIDELEGDDDSGDAIANLIATRADKGKPTAH